MATGDNRSRVVIGGKTYWYNPNTKKYFTSKTGGRTVTPPRLGGNTTTTGKGPSTTTTTGNTGKGGTVTPPPKPPIPTGGTGTVTPPPVVNPGDGVNVGGKLPGSWGNEVMVEQGTGNVWNEEYEQVMDPEGNLLDAGGNVTGWAGDATLLEKLTRILEAAGFTPEAITDLINNVIKPSILKGLSEYEVMKELRKSKTYKDFFPEYQNRIDNGWDPWTEAEILTYRNDARAAIKSIYGKDITGRETAALISNNVSIEEFRGRLETFKKMEEQGGPVSAFFQRALGIKLGDQDLFEFFDPTIQSDLNKAYEDAYYSEYGAQIGLERGATAVELAEFRKKGISVEQAMQNYQQIRNAIPSLDRLSAIDAAVRDDKDNPFDSLGQAMKAMQFMDTDAQQNIGRLISNEIARWGQGGGAAFQGTRAVGLQTASQRAAG